MANLELVKLLVDAGADLNPEDQHGRTALDEAEMYRIRAKNTEPSSTF